jgi:hypothetical protein
MWTVGELTHMTAQLLHEHLLLCTAARHRQGLLNNGGSLLAKRELQNSRVQAYHGRALCIVVIGLQGGEKLGAALFANSDRRFLFIFEF